MKNARVTIAKRYARAYLDIFGDAITVSALTPLCEAAAFFYRHKTRLALQLAPYLDDSYVIQRITHLCVSSGMPASCEHIIRLLVHERRLELLADVLVQICFQYRVRHHIMSCSITSSHALTEHELASIRRFLECKTGYSIMDVYAVDADLIAGLRLQSDTIMWEYSLHKQLAEASRQLIR